MSSGAVVPTACESVLMEDRLAVGSSWNVNRGFAATGKSFASVTSLVAATQLTLNHSKCRHSDRSQLS